MNEELQTKLPEFDEAAARFQEFLTGQIFSSELIWIFREDVSSYKQRVIIKVPIPKGNLRLAKARYEEGRYKGLGISLQVLCAVGSSSYCYIWLPKDEMEAENALMIGHDLKLSRPVDLLRGRAVNNGLLWYAYSWFDKRRRWDGVANQLPRKNV